MATINAALLKGKELKNGKIKVRISVAHKSITKFISTDIVIDSPSQLKNNKIIRHPNSEFLTLKLQKIIRKYEEKLIEIDTEMYSCADIVQILKSTKKDSGKTLGNALEIYLQQLKKPKSKRLYSLSVTRFMKYMKGDVLLSNISTNDIQGFNNQLLKDKLSSTTINIYMTLLKIVIDNAKKLKMVSYNVYPFEVYRKPPSNVRDIDITVKELRRIRDVELGKYNLNVVRDIFMLSYYMAGMNLADMLELNFKGKNTISYIRTKTEDTKKGHNKISFTIPEEAKDIINKYLSDSGKIVFGKYNTRSKVDNLLFRQIQNMATAANINKKVTFYSARKSFVQHGFELGIPLETLEYCIGQSIKRNRPIFNYVKIMSRHADNAIKMILDNLKEDL